ncbi:unnamed protein product [Linum tenue]|uniref:Uncharacterized protein n=1 Tax=Linum tenue TaxID=586396 RepID=A0AAV0ITR8_9ROSI|nr:unnamed protein product [Linum tenue]
MDPPQKTEDDLFHHHHHHHHDLGPPPAPVIIPNHYQSQPSIQEDLYFRSSSPDSPSQSSDNDDSSLLLLHRHNEPKPRPKPLFISPESHISSQFYTFNADSHSLMIRCILEHRLATPDEIRAATHRSVLKSWRAVWKDRNEDTAYVTGWKRIQEKLAAHVDPTSGNEFLCFKNNTQQFVSHINQWQDIVMSFHGDADLKHLGLRETIERIKQIWTVGAKFYGIPESYIRVCVAACPVCSASEGSASRNKRRRFEYTESFDLPAKDVPDKLQQLAAKHKVVLCIRQKYIRYKPFMAEVKDYACHRAGEPAAKKSRMLKREPYASKRCGCGFRIRAIVPIANYNDKDKTFVYQEEGVAVFKLYAVHSGHEPGPLDGNARIMHRVVGHKGGFMTDQEMDYGDEGQFQLSVMQQVQELKAEISLLEGRLRKVPSEYLGSVSQELFDVVNKVRSIGDESSKTISLLPGKPNSDDALVGEDELAHWSDHHDDNDSFGRTLGDVVVPWDQKWLKCSDFDEKSILECEDSKLTKPLRHDDEAIVTDVGLIQVDSFYQDNTKWYDSPCGLDSTGDCGDSEFRHGEMV